MRGGIGGIEIVDVETQTGFILDLVPTPQECAETGQQAVAVPKMLGTAARFAIPKQSAATTSADTGPYRAGLRA